MVNHRRVVDRPSSIVHRRKSGGHMKVRRLSYVFVAFVGIALLVASWNPMSARQAGGATVAVDNDDLGGSGHRPERAGSGRLGHRGNNRPADEIREDRRHERSRTVSDPRSPEGQLQRLGSRLRVDRLAQNADGGRQGDEPHGCGRSKPSRSGAVLPGWLLALPDENSGQERVPRYR